MEYIYRYGSPLGKMMMASDGESLTGLWFDGQKYFARTLSGMHEERDLPVFKETCRWLDVYFGGAEPDFTPPLHPEGTSFQKTVWEFLLSIPYGTTTTYGEIARKMAAGSRGRAVSARAVGGAVGRNPISLIIPCHRVLGSDGSLTGYAGGTDRKARLLALEKQ